MITVSGSAKEYASIIIELINDNRLIRKISKNGVLIAKEFSVEPEVEFMMKFITRYIR